MWKAEISDAVLTNLFCKDCHTKRQRHKKGRRALPDCVGSRETGNGQFNLPNGLYIDGNGRLYVTEVGNDRVSVFK